ncbi:MAG: HK97 gp10 family phage protein [Pyrinomonadaceae bacterium]
MSISITIRDQTPELFQKLNRAIEKFVVKGAGYVEGQLKASMAEPKSGKTYGKHTASAPGESPAVDSGNLTGSISIIRASSLEAKIGTPVEYALYLEHGTSRMAARPLWEKTARESLPTLERMLKSEIGA